MAVQDVLWLGENIYQDETHRLVTDEQIARWDKGTPDPIAESDANNMIETGRYYHSTVPTNGPVDACEDATVSSMVNVFNDLNGSIVQELFTTGADDIVLQKFIRVGKYDTTDTSTITWNHWYEVGLSVVLTKDEKAEYILKDFTYEKDTETGNYVLTGWKGTLDGEPSTEMIIPDTDEIQIEI